MDKNDSKNEPLPWRLFWSEFAGTAILLLIGLSLVILMFGSGSPMADMVTNGPEYTFWGYDARYRLLGTDCFPWRSDYNFHHGFLIVHFFGIQRNP